MKKMVNFKGTLSLTNDAFVVFVSEKYEYRDEKKILSKDIIKKIDSFIEVLKKNKNSEIINSFDIYKINHVLCIYKT